MKNISLVFFVFIVLPAQGQHEIQSLYWIRYQTQLSFSPQFYWTNEADNRRFIAPDVQNQFIFHSRLHYKKGPWDFGGGLTFSWGFAQLPRNGYQNVTTEIRPVMEASHETSIGKVMLQNRIRMDNRFFEVNESESIWENSRYVLRWRYRLQARIPIKKSENKTLLALRLADEFMINQNANTFDQNRIYATVETYLNKVFSLETGYIYIYQQRSGSTDFFSRHVLRFSILHKIDLQKKNNTAVKLP